MRVPLIRVDLPLKETLIYHYQPLSAMVRLKFDSESAYYLWAKQLRLT
ncbi:MAG: hypothetical protein ACI9VN_002874 [Patescibacteria group bacterium]|jgi:hypothetical protein